MTAETAEVTLEEVLRNRERRVDLQRDAVKTFGRPVVSITLVNPGPVKDSPSARKLMTHALRVEAISEIDPLRGAISRKTLGVPARRCLLCAEEAHACGRSRAHSLQQLQKAIEEIIHGYREP